MTPLKRYGERILMSRAELAREAGVSVLTIDGIEKGKSCYSTTKRKILLALGLDLSEKGTIFEDRNFRPLHLNLATISHISPMPLIAKRDTYS